jgi:hypothetical protein
MNKNYKKVHLFLRFIAPGSGFGNRIREPDPDPQSHLIRIRIHNPAVKSPVLNVYQM